ncbi:MAG TPA: SDR family oxidoreductase [Polyangiaceae bacterium]|jgi:NAD(P)-dependent dehydrogenase (short-subunit alcohol dehydrogenase family)|nr:SDR family oxidoreductase [Polyangiaceae bacterium]
MFSLNEKLAVITGGGSGIGQAIAILFAKQGARVIVVDLTEEAGGQTKAHIERDGGFSHVYACDVGDAQRVAHSFDAIVQGHGDVDILVNNAGISHVGTIATTDEEDFDRVYRVNVKGMYLCTKAVVTRMAARGGGVILNMASIASLIGVEERFAYTMSKGAVLTMTRSVAVDYVGSNVRCNCICPARVHTPFVDGYLSKAYPGREKEMFEKLSNYQPMGRMGKPEEVAALALYLCSDEASFITGQAFPIDGGVLMK